MNSKIRRFDSQGTDAEALHRFSTCAPMQGIHAIGNGQIMSYGRGPELMQLFGPNYSSPNMLSMVAIPGERMTAESHRIPETHCWQHELSQGTLIDLAPREIPCWVRHWTLNSPVRFLLDLHDLPFLNNAGAYPGHRALLITAPAGSYVYNDYPLLHPEYMQLVFRGDVELVPHEQGEDGVHPLCGLFILRNCPFYLLLSQTELLCTKSPSSAPYTQCFLCCLLPFRNETIWS